MYHESTKLKSIFNVEMDLVSFSKILKEKRKRRNIFQYKNCIWTAKQEYMLQTCKKITMRKKKKRWRGKHSKSLQDYTPVPWNYTTISNKMVQTFLAYDIQLQIAMIIKTGTSANKVYRIKSITSIAEEELRRERKKQKRGRKHCKCWKTPTPPPPKKKIRKSWDDLE